MAAGDASKVWFNEVDAILMSRWHDNLSPVDLLTLAGELTAIMTRVRKALSILAIDHELQLSFDKTRDVCHGALRRCS